MARAPRRAPPAGSLHSPPAPIARRRRSPVPLRGHPAARTLPGQEWLPGRDAALVHRRQSHAGVTPASRTGRSASRETSGPGGTRWAHARPGPGRDGSHRPPQRRIWLAGSSTPSQTFARRPRPPRVWDQPSRWLSGPPPFLGADGAPSVSRYPTGAGAIRRTRSARVGGAPTGAAGKEGAGGGRRPGPGYRGRVPGIPVLVLRCQPGPGVTPVVAHRPSPQRRAHSLLHDRRLRHRRADPWHLTDRRDPPLELAPRSWKHSSSPASIAAEQWGLRWRSTQPWLRRGVGEGAEPSQAYQSGDTRGRPPEVAVARRQTSPSRRKARAPPPRDDAVRSPLPALGVLAPRSPAAI